MYFDFIKSNISLSIKFKINKEVYFYVFKKIRWISVFILFIFIISIPIGVKNEALQPIISKLFIIYSVGLIILNICDLIYQLIVKKIIINMKI